jgi:RNA polymerase sigma-70 factor, ECF subfamily
MSIEAVYDEHVDRVYKFFYIQCFNRHVAEDLTSQTFMIVVERMNDTDYVIGDYTKFVYGVMRNVWLMYLREKYRRHETTLESIEDFAGYVDDEISDYDSQTIKQRAEVFIKQLPDRQRAVLAMRLLEGRKPSEIAQMLGKDMNYVKTTYKRGAKRLKQLIEMNNAPQSMKGIL